MFVYQVEESHIMPVKRILLFIIAWILAQVGLAEPAPINGNAMTSPDQWYFYVTEDGGLWLAYYTTDGPVRKLRLRRPDGVEFVVGPPRREQAPSGLALLAGPDGPRLAWRDKFTRKSLYFQASPDSTPLSIAGDTEPLTRLHLAETDGRIHILWYGEKFDEPLNERYFLYHRSVKPNGSDPSKIQRLMPAIYPLWIVDGEDIAVFSERWRPDGKTDVVGVQTLNPESGEFNDPVQVTTHRFGPTHKAFASGGRWFLVWVGLNEEDSFVLQAAFSDDKGKTWKHAAFDGLLGMDMARIDAAVDERGRIVLAVSGKYPRQPLMGKETVYLIRSDDNGDSWSDPIAVRSDGLEGFRGRLPSVAFGSKPGELIMVWEDWRMIRGVIYASLSQDFGKTWTIREVPLTMPTANYGLPFWTKAVRAYKDGYVLMFERYRDDGMRTKDLFELRLGAKDLERIAAQRTSQAEHENLTQERLKQRADAFWQAFEAENYRTVYSMLDPYYRANQSEESFVKMMGAVKYYSHKFDDVRLEGRLGGLKTTVNSAVPEIMIDGNLVSKEPRDHQFWDLWVFVNGDWHRQFYREVSDKRWTRY